MASRELDNEGYQYLRGAVEESLCRALLAHAEEALEKALKLDLFASKGLFGEIRGPLFRRDLKLRIEAPVAALLSAIVAGQADVLDAAVGWDAMLCECSVLSSDPGADAQPVHCDTSFQGANQPGCEIARLVTIFVALQDVSLEMGPTVLYPRTHTQDIHHQLWLQPKLDCPPLLRNHPQESAVMSIGDALIMDSRLWHRGGANRSDRRRSLLVLSFVSATGERPKGSTYSLLPGIPALSIHNILNSEALAVQRPANSSQSSIFTGCTDIMARLPLQAALILLDLARRGLPDDLVAQQCVDQLGAAVSQCCENEEAESGPFVAVSQTLLDYLAAFRLIGPHLRTSSRWGQMQAAIDHAVHRANSITL